MKIKSSAFFLFFLFSIILISVAVISAPIIYGTSSTVKGKVIYTSPVIINYSSSTTVNNSRYWNGLETPADFFLSMFNGLNWIDETLDLNGQDISDVDKVWFTGSVFISSDDSNHLDIHADYIDLHGNLSTIWEVRLNTNGDGPTGDSVSGELTFGSGGRHTYLYFNGSDFIIIPDALGTGILYIDGDINADSFIGSGAELVDLNVTGTINVSGDFTGYALNTSYLFGAEGIGGIDMRGDPWYFSGADFQIVENLTVDDTGFFNFLGSIVDRITKGWFTDVDIEGNLNQTSGNATINMIYGELWMHKDTTSIINPITTPGVWINISINSTDADASGQTLNGFSYTETCNCLISQIAGKYKIDYSISTGNAGNNQEYQFAIAINDIIQNNTDAHRKIGASGDVGNAGGSGFIDLVINDRINLQARNNDGNADLLVHAVNVNLIRIGS